MKKVIIEIKNGALDIFEDMPEDVMVVVKDYDHEGYDPDDPRRKKEDDGTEYVERVFYH